jgi:uncharacterized protein (TIGR02246 family)
MTTEGQEIVARLAGELGRAWNAGSGEAFARPFTDNADFVNVRGDHFRGRAVIAQGHQGIFDSIYKGSQVRYESEGGYLIAPGVRVGQVRGHLRVPSGPFAGELNGVATLVLVEQDGDWRIAVFHNTLVAPPPSTR